MLAVVLQQDLQPHVAEKIRLAACIRTEASTGHEEQDESFAKAITSSGVECCIVRQRSHRAIVVDLSYDFELRCELMPGRKSENAFRMGIPRKVVTGLEVEIDFWKCFRDFNGKQKSRGIFSDPVLHGS